MKNYIIYFNGHRPVFIWASSCKSACEWAIEYINNSMARLYSGQVPVSAHDIDLIVEPDE